MKNIIQLIKNFEDRNNLSIFLEVHSDGSSSVYEFWDDEEIFEGRTIEELEEFLRNTQYKLDEVSGRCINPLQIV